MGTQKNCLNEMVLLSTQNIFCFVFVAFRPMSTAMVIAGRSKSVVKWTDCPTMTIAVDMGRKATKTKQNMFLIETVLLSTHDICFGWEIRKLNFRYTLSIKVLYQSEILKVIIMFNTLNMQVCSKINILQPKQFHILLSLTSAQKSCYKFYRRSYEGVSRN